MTHPAGANLKKEGQSNGDVASVMGQLTAKKCSIYRSKIVPVMCMTVACWINLACGVGLGYITPVLSELQGRNTTMSLTEEQGTWMASLSMFGGLVGGLCAGPAIAYGRKRALWLAVIPLALAWGLMIAAQSPWYLCFGQGIIGISTGVVSDAAQLYVCEASTCQMRGALGSIPVLMFNMGMLLCYIAASYLSWWHLAIFGAATTAPAMFAPYFLPESPIYLASKGKMKDACAALRWLRGPHHNICGEVQQLEYIASKGKKKPSLRGCVKSCKLLDRTIVKPFIHTITIRLLSRFCGVRPITSYLQSIFTETGSTINKEFITVASGIAQLLGAALAFCILHEAGRRPLLIATQFIMGLSLVGLGLCIYLPEIFVHKAAGLVPLVAVLIYVISNAVGLSPVSGIILSEIVPQNFRSFTSSTTGAMSWLGAFLVTKFFTAIQSGVQTYGAIWVFSCICFLGALYVLIFLPETHGLSQYEIDNLFLNDQNRREDEKTKQQATERV